MNHQASLRARTVCVPLLVVALAASATAATPKRQPRAWTEADSALALKSASAYGEQRVQLVSQATAMGLDEPRILGRLGSLYATCLPKTECHGSAPREADGLFRLLEDLGTERSLSLLTRLEARGVSDATRTRERVLERLMVLATAKTPCTPPTPEQVAATRATLSDFFVVRPEGDALRARPATPAELDDLASFLAAIREELPPGRTASRPFVRDPPASAERDRLFENLRAARRAGDIAAVAANARAYLQTLGYPGEIRSEEDAAGTFHGARYTLVLRHLELAAEELGQFEEAATLYRMPERNSCGNYSGMRFLEKQRGILRTEERLRGCGRVVSIRMAAIEGTTPWRRPTPYGPERLRDAGFDVLRLYRGALVTTFRGHWRLEEAFAALPDGGTAALARLKTKGEEDWASTTSAVEGFADVGRREALPKLVELAGLGVYEALKSIGTLARRPETNPCSATERFPFRHAQDFVRAIRPLADSCETQLSPEEAAALAQQILPLAEREEPHRTTAIEVLGDIGSPAVVPALTRMLDDPTTGCETKPKTESCEPSHPIRTAAAKALERIAKVEEAWRSQPPADGGTP